MKKILLALSFLVLSVNAFAGDYHQDGQGHLVSYTITDVSGDPVSGQTPRVAVYRTSDGLYLDHSDGTFKNPTTATTLYQSMTYNQTGGFYFRVITIDTAILVSGDYACIVSNDDAVYGDTQTEVIEWDNLNNLIKIHR